MIRKLRREFILIAMLSLAGVTSFYALLVVVGSHVNIAIDARRVIDYLNATDGVLSEGVRVDGIDFDVTSDSKFQYRFLTVDVGADGRIGDVNMNYVPYRSAAELDRMADDIVSDQKTYGRIDNFYYGLFDRDGGERFIVMLDCSQRLSSHRQLKITAVWFVVVTTLLVLIPVILLSGKAIRPEVENAEKQKQFITNASHELKTPLSVIRANTELMEIMYGSSEWTKSTLAQVDRMNDLIKDLVSLTRYEEHKESVVFEEFDVSAVVSSSVRSFTPVAEQKGLRMTSDVTPGLRLRGDAEGIKQLSDVLLDNAVKYCDEGGEIKTELRRSGRKLRLVCSNDYAAGKNENYSKYFERFYRADESHRIDASKGGYGIGLSIARSVVESHKGNIAASWKDGRIIFTVEL